MGPIISVTDDGASEAPYKCMVRNCKDPTKVDVGIRCCYCLKTAHLQCSNMKNFENPSEIEEWYCGIECQKSAEVEKLSAQIENMNKQLEASRVLLQRVTERFESKGAEDALREAEMARQQERIKALEGENRRISSYYKSLEKSKALKFDVPTQSTSECNLNEQVNEKDALEIFASNETDEEFKKRLTGIFHTPISRKDSSTSIGRHKTKQEIDAMSETEKLAYYQRLHVQRLEAPKLMRYAGDPAEWLSFKASYERMRERGEYDNETMVDKLRDALQGEAERYVKPRLNQPFADADSIMEALRKRFFQPKEAVAKAWEKLECWTQIPDKNRKALENFLVEIDSYIFLCKDLNFKPELEIAINSRITNKLPYSIESKWHSFVSDKNIRGNITEFSEFMWSFVPNLPNREMSMSSTSGQAKIRASVNVVQHEACDKTKPFATKKAKRDSVNCWYCGKDNKHPLFRCNEFRNLLYEEKTKFLVNNKICARCLTSNQHTSTTCPKAQRISKCMKKNCTDPASHCTIMHPPSCNGTKNPPQATTASTSSSTTLHVTQNSATMFKVVPIYVIDGHGNRVETTLLMDRAAGTSLVNMNFFNRLHISGKKYKLELSWLQPDAKHTDTEAVLHDLTIAPINDPTRLIKLNGMTALPNVTLPYQEQHPEIIKAEYPYLRNAQIPAYNKQRPQILLGLPHAKWMISLETLIDFSRDSAPIAEKTPLGWTICYGTGPSKPMFHCCEQEQSCIHKTEPAQEMETLQELHELVKFYNSFESFGVKHSNEKYLCKEDVHALDIQKKTMRRVENRYEIGLYWRNEECTLPDNYETALKRLRATEARLKQLGMSEWANDHQKSLLEQGFAREATLEDFQPQVPHKRINYVIGFVTFNLNKQPPKPRWVVDTSCKHQGISLNSRLLKGPDNLIPLTQALFHFRERKFAVVSDVTKMYHQILIKSEDQQVQRFLWRNCNSLEEPKIYIFQNMLFGLNCSPSQANAVRIDHCEKNELKYPIGSRIGLNSMYMDDAFNSEDTQHEAIQAATETIQLFNDISWKMVDFKSNSEEVLKKLPHEAIDQDLLMDLSSEDDMTSRKVLGLFWDAKKDVFKFQMTNNLELLSLSLEHDYHPTKREVLSFIMKIFDCLGLISHFHIRGRMILQAIWRRGIAWEQHIPDDIHESWIKWLQKFEEIQKLEIPRHYGFNSSSSSNIALHIFVDASPEAYATVAYLRFETNKHVQVALVMAKCRVAPVKYASVPKLELMAALLGARLMEVIKNQHKRLKIESFTFWSDSITVLRWLYSPCLRLQQFVAPRVTEIQDITNVNDWRYIASEENVADDGTKWNDIDFSSPDHRWIKGPKFLYEDESSWPPKFPTNVNLPQQDTLLLTKAIQSKADLDENYYCGIFENVSSKIRADWKSYVTVVAWVNRFKNNLLASIRGTNLNKGNFLEANELHNSEKLIFSRIQKSIFVDEVKSLQKGLPVAQSSNLYTMNPFMSDDGLIRAKTRMYKEDTIPYDMRCPPILPNKHETVHAFLQYLHNKNKHVGIEGILAEARAKAWIIHGRKAVKRVSHQCLYCAEMRASHRIPPIAPLPSYRTDSNARPFEHCGADCAGPFTIYAGNSYVKKDVNVVVFTCMTTRAVYLRKLDSLTADEMMLAIQDVWTRRGPIRHMYSDNGRNFFGASNIIKAEHHAHLAKERQMTWHFSPPLTPHWGGVWERLIQDIKRALNVEMHKKIIREKVFESTLLQIEDIMNSRPLTHIPVSPDDYAPLTPNFLLKLHPGYSFVGDNQQAYHDDTNLTSLKAKKIAEKLMQRWLKEYLPIITKTEGKRARKEGLKVGDYVIYTDPTTKPSDWKRGLVVNVYTGRDGYARIADIKLTSGEIIERRSVVRLAKLEIDDESRNKIDSTNCLFAADLTPICNGQNSNESYGIGTNCTPVTINNSQENFYYCKNNFIKMIGRGVVENLGINQIIRLMNELGEANFVSKSDIYRQKSGEAKNIYEAVMLNYYEDLKNERTIRVKKIPQSCCFMQLLLIIANHGCKITRVIVDSISQEKGYYANITFNEIAGMSRALSLKSFEINGRKCEIVRAERSKSSTTFKGFEFSMVTWNLYDKFANDHILLGRMKDKPTKINAVPVLSKRWLDEYNEYRQYLKRIAPAIMATYNEPPKVAEKKVSEADSLPESSKQASNKTVESRKRENRSETRNSSASKNDEHKRKKKSDRHVRLETTSSESSPDHHFKR